jgi:YesN/AraC family two-component response regulator
MLSLIPDLDVVAIAQNGKEAIEMAQNSNPDIAIMDINMPEVDGLSAYEAMLDQNPDIECIVISGEKDGSIVRKAMSVGATEYLIKPFTVDELSMAIYKVGKEIEKKREDRANLERLRKQREEFITQLAEEYAKSRRVDDKAVAVFEHLARNPKCDLYWLRVLSMVYVIRGEWGKLRVLALRLENQNNEVDV